MNKVAATTLVMAFASSAAFGGVIRFAPASVDVDINGDTGFAVDIIVDSTVGGTFNSVDILVWSDDLTLIDFTWGPWGTRFFDNIEPNPNVYWPGILIGFFGTEQQDGLTLGKR